MKGSAASRVTPSPRFNVVFQSKNKASKGNLAGFFLSNRNPGTFIYVIEELSHMLVPHAEAAIRYCLANRGWIIRAVDPNQRIPATLVEI